MQPLGLRQQQDLHYQATTEQRGQGTCSKRSQKLPARSDQQQLAPRWVTLRRSAPVQDAAAAPVLAESHLVPGAAALHESKTLPTSAILS